MPSKKRTVKTPPPEEKTSWWKTLPGIITGITAFIIAVTGLITALSTVPWPDLPRGKGDCERYGEGLLTSSVRVGSTNMPIFEYGAPESLAQARILDVTDSGSKIIGKVQFRYDLNVSQFEILSVVDETCWATSDEPYFVEAGQEFPVLFKDAYIIVLNLKDDVITASVKKQDE